MKVVMKVNKKMTYSAAGICDFCGMREAKHSINGSLWFVCSPCMDVASLTTQELLYGEGEEE